jgi:hypothetical protein
VGRDSSVGIATGYGLDGPGIVIPVGARFFTHVQTVPGAHPASCTMGIGSLPRVESGRGVTLTSHPLLVPRSKKQSRAIPLLSLRAFTACKKGETYLNCCLRLSERCLAQYTSLATHNDARSAPCWSLNYGSGRQPFHSSSQGAHINSWSPREFCSIYSLSVSCFVTSLYADAPRSHPALALLVACTC